MNDFQMIPVGGSYRYTFDFTDSLPSTSPATTVTACAFTITPTSGSPTAPVLSAQTDDFTVDSNTSTIQVTGATHGAQYMLQASATLSNGETVVKDCVLLGFNG